MLTYSNRTIGIVGNVWTGEHGERLQTLVIEKGRIVKLMDGKVDLKNIPGIAVIELEEGTVIFPGLLNLHTHVGYNILPIWESRQVWKNRFQWRSNEGYKQQIGGLLDYIKSKWTADAGAVAMLVGKGEGNDALAEVEKAHAIISEIQAVAGGTTIIQQTLDLDDEQADDRSFIIRNTGDQVDLPIPADKQVNSVVDFYEPNVKPDGTSTEDTSSWTPVAESTFTNWVKSVNNNNLPYYATLVHVGEGKAGFVKGSETDPYSRKEVAAFFQGIQKDITDGTKLAGARLAITHGCGMDVANAEWLQFVGENRVHWIWSPVSNLLLYRDTLDVRKLLDAGVSISLGSDWSPSGSKHVLDELKFARFVNQLLDLGISDRELFKMVADNPAAALGLTRSGSVKEGGNADLFVLRKREKGGDALLALLESSDKDIDFVMVNGRIVFGLKRYFGDPLQVDYQEFPESEGAAVSLRGVSINKEVGFDLASSLKIIDTLMERYGTTVLDEPGLRRTKFMAADDRLYQKNISTLRDELTQLYWG